MHLKNLSNIYVNALESRLFDKTPKTVFAAIAVSYASRAGDYLDLATDNILREWTALYDNGIVKQKPPRRVE